MISLAEMIDRVRLRWIDRKIEEIDLDETGKMVSKMNMYEDKRIKILLRINSRREHRNRIFADKLIGRRREGQ